MMTPRPLVNAQQAAVYYEADDYYVDGQHLSPSSWWGEGARRLGLRGSVDRETFHELLHGRLPNGVDIARGGGKSHRPGLDLTFSAPKSVSLVALVSADDRVLKAHEHAVTVALSHLEERAVRARATKEGVTRTEETDNLLVARFNHDSSLALDPQLHTHAVVLNATQRSDGAWEGDRERRDLPLGQGGQRHLSRGACSPARGARLPRGAHACGWALRDRRLLRVDAR